MILWIFKKFLNKWMSEWKEFNLKSNDTSINQGFLQVLDLKNDFKYGMV